MSDILKLVKAVNEKCQSKDGSVDHRYWAFRSVELLPELIAEIERLRSQSVEQVFRRKNEEIAAKDARIKELQDLIDKPPEEADWVADYHLLQSALDGPIIDAARKWHAAYRKAQNSNLMRAKEVERLRSELVIAQFGGWQNLREQISAKDARIKELKAVISEAFRELVTAGPDIGDIATMDISLAIRKLASQNKRLEAAFMEAKRCPTCNGAGKLIDVVISRNLGRVESERVCPLCEGKGEEKAREALEEIKAGGKDVP